MAPPPEDAVVARAASPSRADGPTASHPGRPHVAVASLGSDVRRHGSVDKLVAASPPTSGQLAAQRTLDLCLASIGILLFLIPGIVIAVLVGCTSRGPIFFTQDRVGRGGRSFRVFKFRTMRDGTHQAVLEDEMLRAMSWMPFLSVVIAAFIPLAAVLYITTSTVWTYLERTVLRRLL